MSNESAPKFKYPDVNPHTGLYQEDYLIKYEQKTIDTACARINKWCRYLFCGDKNAKIARVHASEVYSYSNSNNYMQTLHMAKMALNENLVISTSDNYLEAVEQLNIFLSIIDERFLNETGEEENLKEMKKDISDVVRRIQRIAVCKQREEEVNQIFQVGNSLKVTILALNQSVSQAIKNSDAANSANTESQ
jgi:hypothetical protein